MATMKTLDQALKDILKDHSKLSKYDAVALKQVILADDRVSTEEKLFLERAIKDNHFDDKAYGILNSLLMRNEQN